MKRYYSQQEAKNPPKRPAAELVNPKPPPDQDGEIHPRCCSEFEPIKVMISVSLVTNKPT